MRRKKEPSVNRVVAKQLRELATEVLVKGIRYDQVGKLQQALQHMVWYLAEHREGL